MVSDRQVPLFWHGAARQGAHFDIRLISTGPEKDNKKQEQMRVGGEYGGNEGIKIRRQKGSKGVSAEETYIFTHVVLKGTPTDFI